MSNLKSKDFPKDIRDKNPNLDEMLEQARNEDVYLKYNSVYDIITVEQRSKYRKNKY